MKMALCLSAPMWKIEPPICLSAPMQTKGRLFCFSPKITFLIQKVKIVSLS